MEELESDVVIRKFLFGLVGLLESKINNLCSQTGNSNKEREEKLLAKLALLYPRLLGFVAQCILPIQKEKVLPVSLENFAEGELDRVDELLKKIIRQRAYKQDLEAKLKQARLDLETLKSINKAFEDHKAITDNAITSFDLASQMYNNISTTSALAEKQGLVKKDKTNETSKTH